jgi:anti-anti-sigma factor
MAQSTIHIDVRGPAEGVGILDIQGEITGSAEGSISAAYAATGSEAKAIILNLSEVQSINSLGAGLLIALVAHAGKRKQRLMAFGLSETCRRAFRLIHLDEVVGIYTDEAEALGSL